MDWVEWTLVGVLAVVALSFVCKVFWSVSIAASVIGMAAGARSNAPVRPDRPLALPPPRPEGDRPS